MNSTEGRSINIPILRSGTIVFIVYDGFVGIHHLVLLHWMAVQVV